MDRECLLDATERETSAFLTVLEHCELDAPVRSCPDWHVAGLAAHLGGVHRWARNAVVERAMREDPSPSLGDRQALVAWYALCAEQLIDALRATPAGTPCPGFGARPRTVDFWVRRQAHESAVHRWDADLASGSQPVLDPELSADGVGEVIEVLLPRQIHLGRTPPPLTSVSLERTDGPERWTVGQGESVATVRADAGTLLLVLWRRCGLDVTDVQGDVAAATALLSDRLTP